MKMLYAMEEVGFMVLTNHGIPKHVMDETWNRTRDFFDSPLENKEAVQMTKDYIYGYSADEILSKSEEIKYFKNGSVDHSEAVPLANDQKEMFAGSRPISLSSDLNVFHSVFSPLTMHCVHSMFLQHGLEHKVQIDWTTCYGRLSPTD